MKSFFDDFGGEPGATLPGGVHISNGELVVDIPEGQGSNFYEPAIDWSQVSAQEGYRISVDVRKSYANSGYNADYFSWWRTKYTTLCSSD